MPRCLGQPPPAAASHSSCRGPAAACLILETRHVNASKPALFFRVVFAKGCLHRHMHRWDGATATLMSPVAWRGQSWDAARRQGRRSLSCPPQPFPKGLGSLCGGIRGCSGLNHREKHRAVRKSRERVCEQGEESEITKIAIAGEQFQLLTIKIEINAVFVWHMYQLMAHGYWCAC